MIKPTSKSKIENKTKVPKTGKGSFGGKRNTNGFGQNPQNVNRKGRPKRGVAVVNAELEKAGYVPVTRQDIELNYMSMLSLETEDLIKIMEDSTKPILVKIIAENLLSGKGFDIAEKMLDRSIGKAMQREEVTNTVKVVSTEELDKTPLEDLRGVIESHIKSK